MFHVLAGSYLQTCVSPTIVSWAFIMFYETSFKAILKDEDNVIDAKLTPQGGILIRATYETGKVVQTTYKTSK